MASALTYFILERSVHLEKRKTIIVWVLEELCLFPPVSGVQLNRDKIKEAV